MKGDGSNLGWLDLDVFLESHGAANGMACGLSSSSQATRQLSCTAIIPGMCKAVYLGVYQLLWRFNSPDLMCLS